MATWNRAPRSDDELLARLEEDGIERLWVTYQDYNGRVGGKIIPKAGFRGAIESGIVFAKANLNFDRRDVMVDDGFYANDGDFLAFPDPVSYGVLPQFPATARVHTFMRGDDGAPWDGCPRTRLLGLVEGLRAEGFSVKAALEPEFYLVTRNEGGDLIPVERTHMYSTSGLAGQEPVLRRILDLLEGMGVRVPQLGREFSPGQYELSTAHGDPISAADSYLAVREAVRDAATEAGYEATFMPKPYADWSGNSLHVHLSLWDAAGERDLTPDTRDSTSISPIGRHFIAGLLHHAAALTGLSSPTPNSFKRLQPGSWAPANTYWGYGNRSGVIRIPGYGGRRHIEYRAGDNTAHPQLLLIGLIAAGMDGVRRRLDAGEPFSGDVGHMTVTEMLAAGLGFLPRSLPEALAALEADETIRHAVGPQLLADYLRLRRNELAHYELQVHAWERETYFPIV